MWRVEIRASNFIITPGPLVALHDDVEAPLTMA
jgi:hypothetical protein